MTCCNSTKLLQWVKETFDYMGLCVMTKIALSKKDGSIELKKVHSKRVLVEGKKAAELNGKICKVHRVHTYKLADTSELSHVHRMVYTFTLIDTGVC